MVREIAFFVLGHGKAERVVRSAFERGITLFHTANAYKDSEGKISRALSEVRDRVVLATKSFKRDWASLRGPGEQPPPAAQGAGWKSKRRPRNVTKYHEKNITDHG